MAKHTIVEHSSQGQHGTVEHIEGRDGIAQHSSETRGKLQHSTETHTALTSQERRAQNSTTQHSTINTKKNTALRRVKHSMYSTGEDRKYGVNIGISVLFPKSEGDISKRFKNRILSPINGPITVLSKAIEQCA